MKFETAIIHSPQPGPHHQLEYVVGKHLNSDYLKPIQEHNNLAFSKFLDAVREYDGQSLILDSCCGTGLSTRHIAKHYPKALVVGIDQSKSRIERHCEEFEVAPANTLFLRANCEDFWRLCYSERIVFDKHYILYPNPYPKPEHLKRRWHGHPVFPVLPKLAIQTELRSNWRTYLEEFNLAWSYLKQPLGDLRSLNEPKPITLFERKYKVAMQPLFKLIAQSNSVLTQ